MRRACSCPFRFGQPARPIVNKDAEHAHGECGIKEQCRSGDCRSLRFYDDTASFGSRLLGEMSLTAAERQAIFADNARWLFGIPLSFEGQ
jgi:hypothetical protein